MPRWFLSAIVALACLPAYAGGRGGPNTTFDPNSYGGGWTCIRQVSDTAKCGGATAQFFGAVCDGVTDDVAAIQAWVTYGIAQNPGLAKLNWAGCNMHSSGGISLQANIIPAGGSGISNSIIWVYGGGSIDNVAIGGNNIYQDNDSSHLALIQSTNIGDSSVTLVTAADATKLHLGDWVLVDGYALQVGGAPPNFEFYEFRIITSITGTTTKVIGLNAPLSNQYLSTWPLISDVVTGGPATIHLLQPSWVMNAQVFGLTVTGINQVNIIGRTITIQGSLFGINGFAPSVSQSVNIFNTTNPVAEIEIDKDIEALSLFRYSGAGTLSQSPSPTNLLIDSSHVNNISGTAKNTTIRNTKVATELRVGPGSYAAGGSLVIDGSTFPIGSSAISRNIPIADLSFSAGVLSIANNSVNYNPTALPTMVPGITYYFGESDGTDSSVPHTTFVLSGVTTDGTSTFYAMSNCSWGACSGALPTPTCGSGACSVFVPYPVTTVKQTNTGSSPSLTGFAIH